MHSVRGSFRLCVMAALAFLGAFPSTAQSFIFWTDDGSGAGIHRMTRDGTNDQYLFYNSDLAIGNEGAWLNNIAADPVNQKIYWSEYYGGLSQGRIERCNFDGSDRETVVPVGTYRPGGIVLDPENQHIYWISVEYGIERQNYDGSGQTTIVAPSLCGSVGMAAYLRGNKLFWIGPSGILSANMDGSNVTTIVSAPGVYPWDVAVDPVGLRIYWVALGPGLGQGSLHSAWLDGGEQQMLLSSLDEPNGIAIDPIERRIYWAELHEGVRRAHLDGSNAQTIHAVEPPVGITLDTATVEPAVPVAGTLGMTIVAWALLVLGGVAAGRRAV